MNSLFKNFYYFFIILFLMSCGSSADDSSIYGNAKPAENSADSNGQNGNQTDKPENEFSLSKLFANKGFRSTELYWYTENRRKFRIHISEESFIGRDVKDYNSLNGYQIKEVLPLSITVRKTVPPYEGLFMVDETLRIPEFNKMYYFIVTAFSDEGEEAVFTNEVNFYFSYSADSLIFYDITKYEMHSFAHHPVDNKISVGTDKGEILIYTYDTDGNFTFNDAVKIDNNSTLNHLEYSPDGNHIIAISPDDRKLYVWDVLDNTQKTTVSNIGNSSANYINATFNNDGTMFAGFSGNSVFIRNIDGSEYASLEGHDGSVTAVDFSPDGRKLVSVGKDNKFRIWDVDTQNQDFVSDNISCNRIFCNVLFNPDPAADNFLITYDNDVGVFNSDGTSVKTIELYEENIITNLEFSPDGKKLASLAIVHGFLAYLSPLEETLFLLRNLENDDILLNDRDLYNVDISGNTNLDFMYHPGGDWFFNLTEHTKIEFRRSTGDKISELKSQSFIFDDFSKYLLASHPDNNRVFLTGGERGKVYYWEKSPDSDQTPHPKWSLDAHDDDINIIAFNHDGSKFLTAAKDNSVKLWDTASASQIGADINRNSSVESAVFSEDGSLFILGLADGTVEVWSLLFGDPSMSSSFSDHTDEVNAVTFGSDSNIIISGSSDDTIVIRNLQKNEILSQINADQSGVDAIVFNSNINRFASVGEESHIKIWDGSSFELIHTIGFGYEKAENSDKSYITSDPEGKLIVSGYGNKLTLFVWDLGVRINKYSDDRGFIGEFTDNRNFRILTNTGIYESNFDKFF